ncbi:MAG: HDIG domain-containing protein [Armatimonadetes bacterium]|nr:HDIG domain-containing protein [Armatimonadota bacterium]
MHPALELVRDACSGTPFEGHVWLVGGAVRDALLGLPEAKDLDLVTDLDALKLAEHLAAKGLSDHLPVTYPRFGTAKVRIGGADIEIVTARKESYRSVSRKPKVEAATLQEDARRRDFTVNALMQDLWSGEVLDLLGNSVDDLKGRVLRTPLEPGATFEEDPLRMLRAVRFRWQLGLEPAEGLVEAIERHAQRLAIISRERVQEEFRRMLLLPQTSECLRALLETGLLAQFAPELCALRGLEQGVYHHLDAWDHTLAVLDGVPTGDLVLRLAALLHDVAKPLTRTEDPTGRVRFLGHEAQGAKVAERVLRRLKFSNSVIAPVRTLVANHMRPSSTLHWGLPAARRLRRDLGGELERLMTLAWADRRAHAPGAETLGLESLERVLGDLEEAEEPREELSPLSGEEIKTVLGLHEGPEVGKWKRWLEDEVIEGRLPSGDIDMAKRALLGRVRALKPPSPGQNT